MLQQGTQYLKGIEKTLRATCSYYHASALDYLDLKYGWSFLLCTIDCRIGIVANARPGTAIAALRMLLCIRARRRQLPLTS